MCLAFPYKIKKISGKKATVQAEDKEKEINIELVPEAKENDWVLVNNSYGVLIVTEERAHDIIDLSCEIRGDKE